MLLAASLAFSIQPYVGLGSGELDWNIAAGLAPGSSPNVLSELEFDHLESYSGGVRIRLSLQDLLPRVDFFVEGDGNFQAINDGEGTDTDYSNDNRTSPYSQSVSEITGDDLKDLSGGIGLSLTVFQNLLNDGVNKPVLNRHILSLIGGGTHKEQNLNFQNGTQIIADPGFFFPTTIGDLNASLVSLDSDYITEWQAFWLAGQYDIVVGDWKLYGRLQYFDGTYYGEGRWNLRANLQQPKSFTHHADATGRRYEMGVQYFFNDTVSMSVSWQKEEWEADPGTDLTFFTNNTVQRTRLNQANWQASEWRVGLGLHF